MAVPKIKAHRIQYHKKLLELTDPPKPEKEAPGLEGDTSALREGTTFQLHECPGEVAIGQFAGRFGQLVGDVQSEGWNGVMERMKVQLAKLPSPRAAANSPPALHLESTLESTGDASNPLIFNGLRKPSPMVATSACVMHPTNLPESCRC